MSKIELPTITSGYNLSTINNNFQKIEDTLNKEVLYRKGYLGEPNEMQTNLDMNGNQILNVTTGTSDGSLVTKGYVDQGLALKFDKSGGTLSGPVDMQNNQINNLPNATKPSQPATYAQLLQVEAPGDSLLRSELAAPGGAGLVGGLAISVGSIKDLATAPKIDGRQYSVKGFYAGTDVGGGLFYWDASRDKTEHNGGTIIDPDRIDAWDGTQADLATLFAVGSGSGCFVRIHSIPLAKQEVNPQWFGAVGNNDECSIPFQKAIDVVDPIGGTLVVPDGDYKMFVATGNFKLDESLSEYWRRYFSVEIKQNANIKMSSKTKLIVDNGGDTSTFGCVIFIREGARNVLIDGGLIVGDRPSLTQRHGIQVYGDTQDVKIKNVRIESVGGDGISVSTHDTTYEDPKRTIIENCYLYDCGRMGLTIGTASNTDVIGCVFDNMIYNLPKAGIDIEPNYGGAIRTRIINCDFIDCGEQDLVCSQGNNLIVSGCRFGLGTITRSGIVLPNLSNPMENIIVSDSYFYKRVNLSNYTSKITFNNCHFIYETETQAKDPSVLVGKFSGEALFNSCVFYNKNTWAYYVPAGSIAEGLVKFSDCSFHLESESATNGEMIQASGARNTIFEDCNIYFNSPYILVRDYQSSKGITFKGCKITGGPNVANMMARVRGLRFLDCEISYNNYDGILYANGATVDGEVSGCTFYMENLTAKTVYQTVNDSKAKISDNEEIRLFNGITYKKISDERSLPEFNAIPDGTGWISGSVIKIKNPSAGGFLGYVCTQTGVAASTEWVTSTAYSQGDFVFYGGNVYKASSSGTSGATAPSHTSGTVSDGGVDWEYIGSKVQFKGYGAIEA